MKPRLIDRAKYLKLVDETVVSADRRIEELERRLRLIADVAGGMAPGTERERLAHVRDLARELVT